MGIPPFKELNRQTIIEINTPKGEIKLRPHHFSRGDGYKNTNLLIKGVIESKIEFNDQCFVTFQGKQIQGNFSECRESNGLFLATFETIISAPEFWGDTEQSL